MATFPFCRARASKAGAFDGGATDGFTLTECAFVTVKAGTPSISMSRLIVNAPSVITLTSKLVPRP